jgi:hypothetical protein
MVKGFNGQPVNNLSEMARMVEACKQEYLRFELDFGLLVVLKASEAAVATQDILATHCIPSAKSADLA